MNRTIYARFGNEAELFESVIQESARAGVRVFLRGYLPAPGSGSRRPAAG